MSNSACPFLNPHDVFRDLATARQIEGLVYADTFGMRLVTRYDDIVEVLHQPDTFSSHPAGAELPPEYIEKLKGRAPTRGQLIGADNPDHDRRRSAVNTFFMPRRLARYEPWIREEAHKLIDQFVEQGEIDLKQAFTLPLPLRLMTKVVGLDPERANWVGRALGFYLGDRDLYHQGTLNEKEQRLLDLVDYINQVMAERKVERRDDLISHIFNERDAGNVEITDFEIMSMFPGMMLAGHETSSNMICTGLTHLLEDRSRYDAAQKDDVSRARAIEEFARFESAITGMPRLVMEDTTVGGIPVSAGEKIFLAYAAGSRDPKYFTDPETFDLDRRSETAHLGFGQGIHACLGAPLARLLLRIELEVIGERLPDLELAIDKRDLRYTVIAEGRGVVTFPVRWTPGAPRDVNDIAIEAQPLDREVPVTVRSRRDVAEGVVELTLGTVDDSPINWEAGAHVDLMLQPGMTRQYSIFGPKHSSEVKVAVLQEPAGRGGSAFVHSSLREGAQTVIHPPRNHFRFVAAPFSLFVAGGIGITPLLAMIDEVEAAGTDWRLLYLGRTRKRMAYVDELESTYPGKIYVWPSEERGRFDLESLWARIPTKDAYIYCCGPEALMSALEESGSAAGYEGRVVVERFAPRPMTFAQNTRFAVTMERSGITVDVSEDESVLEAVNRAGAQVLSTCQEGTCGTCEVRVLAGVPEHRDSVLTAHERLENTSMMVCVSRCHGKRLVLDL